MLTVLCSTISVVLLFDATTSTSTPAHTTYTIKRYISDGEHASAQSEQLRWLKKRSLTPYPGGGRSTSTLRVFCPKRAVILELQGLEAPSPFLRVPTRILLPFAQGTCSCSRTLISKRFSSWTSHHPSSPANCVVFSMGRSLTTKGICQQRSHTMIIVITPIRSILLQFLPLRAS